MEIMRLTPHPRGTPANIRMYLIFLETRIIDLHFTDDSLGWSSYNFFLVHGFFSARVRFGLSRSSKVIDFDTNRKHVCDFLLVRHSNLGPILHHFRDIAGFGRILFYSTLILGVFPLHQIAHGVSSSINIKLISSEIIFEAFQPMWSRYLNVTDRRTDRQTDRQRDDILWHNRVASRGKNFAENSARSLATTLYVVKDCLFCNTRYR